MKVNSYLRKAVSTVLLAVLMPPVTCIAHTFLADKGDCP